MGSVTYDHLHRWHHDDYAVAHEHILRQLGDISESMVFGRQVLCAVYVRPGRTRAGLEFTGDKQNEDIHSGKTMMVLQLGPSAFSGDADYLHAMYGAYGPPKPGDWVAARANVGEAISIQGEDAERVKHEDRRGDLQDTYPWEGWPCRIVQDESLLMRVNKPHQVV